MAGATTGPMLFKLYLLGLIVGGVLLAASMVGGDGDAGGGVDADGDLDGDAGHDTLAPTHGDVGGLAAMFLSLRFWSFFAAFFGLTGLVLDGFELTGLPLLTLGLSVGTGLLCGVGAAQSVRLLTRGQTGEVPGSADFIGQTGRVLLPVGGSGPGKIRLELGGTTVDVLAVTDDTEPLAVGDTALVVEMRETTASVTRMNGGRED